MLRVLVVLPYRLQMKLGRGLGRVAMKFLRERQRIATVNLRICFPELGDAEIQALVTKHFESLGMSVFELAMAWWLSTKKVEKLIHLEGIENITGPLHEGRGVVLLSGHFASIEFPGRLLAHNLKSPAAMYQPMHNPMVDQIIRRGRRGTNVALIPKNDIRQMIRTLRNGQMVWYAPDQSYSGKYSELVPFFSEPAMTNAALTHIARISKACIVLAVPRRLENGGGYYTEIEPALENFPTDDPAADALRVNQLLEEKIRLAPEQYYWIHRRFKNRPAPYPDPYNTATDDH